MTNKFYYNKVSGWVKVFLLFYLFTFLPYMAVAVTKAQADSAYQQEHYQQAAQIYECRYQGSGRQRLPTGALSAGRPDLRAAVEEWRECRPLL